MTPESDVPQWERSVNPRLHEADAIVDFISTQHESFDAVLIVGDMGDDHTATQWFSTAGYSDPYTLLDLSPQATFPSNSHEHKSPIVRDWMFSNTRLRPAMVHTIPTKSSFHTPLFVLYEILPP